MRDALAELRDRFRARSATDLTRLQALVQGDLKSKELRHLVHSLAGAAGTFGFPTLSTAAILIDDDFATGRTPDRSSFDRLERELEAMSASQA